MPITLTDKQAYAAMILFLERYGRNTDYEGNVAALLSAMHVVTDEETWETLDSGYWDEWLEDVQQVLQASETPEAWEQFEADYLAYTTTAPDGNCCVLDLGSHSPT